MADFPILNSDAAREQQNKETEKPNITSIEPSRRDLTLGEKIRKSMPAADLNDATSYIVDEVFIPALLNGISDAWHGVGDIFFGPSSGRGRARRSSNNQKSKVSWTSYDAYYESDNDRRRSISRDSSVYSDLDYNTITMDTHWEAVDVRDDMLDYLERYHRLSINDYYDILRDRLKISISSDPTDVKYGWTNLSRSEVKHCRDGYYIWLPRPQLLDRKEK